MKQPEGQLTPFVSALLQRTGYDLVMPSAPSARQLRGKGEFGIEVSGDRIRRVDVVGARWESEWEIRACAVECKATLWAVYDALGQAVQYQSLFDEVYVATPVALENDSIARSTLVDLGIGHIRVDPDSKSAHLSVAPQVRHPSRFEPYRKASQVAPSLALGLAFIEVAGRESPCRYGFTQPLLEVWYAEEVTGHLQWNCWHVSRSKGEREANLYAGINAEHAEDIRRILDAVSEAGLQSALASVPKEYVAEVKFDPHPATPGREGISAYASSVPEANAATVLKALREAPRKFKAHFNLRRETSEHERRGWTRSDYEAMLRQVREHLAPVMRVLEECYR